jgi:hypothetical protein
MTYFVIDKDNKAFYIGEDKAIAIKTKKEQPTATFILYQPQPDGEKYILRENH